MRGKGSITLATATVTAIINASLIMPHHDFLGHDQLVPLAAVAVGTTSTVT